MTQNGMRQYDERLVPGPAILGGGPDGQPHRPDMNEQAKALQVLTMAQRTAEEHIESARREAEQIRSDAHAQANAIVTEAQNQADALRDEADKILNRARLSAEKIAREAEAFAVDTERTAGEVMADAQGRAEEIYREAQAQAHDIRQRAEQVYEDVVGGLTAKRSALQGQIEALERFDQEYRGRLTAFMQQQMRALWVGQPQVGAEEIEEAVRVPAELLPAQRRPEGQPPAEQHQQLDDEADEDEDELEPEEAR